MRYALTIKVNGFDPSVAGAALYELGLIPDLELHQDHSMLVRKLVKNRECVQIINRSEKSAIATVYDLQLEGEDVASYPLVTLQEVKEGSFFNRAKDYIMLQLGFDDE